MTTKEQEELWVDQTRANFEARQILGIGPGMYVIGDLPDEAHKNAIAEGVAKALQCLDKKYTLEQWYNDEEEILGLYFCSKCQHNHYFQASQIGENHLKYRMPYKEHAQTARAFYCTILNLP